MEENIHTPFRNCPVCGNTEVEILRTQRFELPVGHPLSQGYDIVKCFACGFVYADTKVSQADYDRFYIEYSKYEDKKTGTGGGENPFDQIRFEITARQLVNYLKDPSARILDVGCANGGLLKALKNLGFENLCGLDPSSICVENTRSLGLEAYTGSLFQAFPYGKFDCVILSHTLEHVQDVNGAIAWISEMLKPEGKQIVYIEVPDATRYTDFLYAPFQDFNTEHINHFSEVSLKNLMGRIGFETIEISVKTLTISPNMFYPAIYGFWKKTKKQPTMEIVPDTQLGEQIGLYIHESQKILDAIEMRLQKILRNPSPVIVWGTGQLALKLLVETSLGKANIAAFIDNNPINQGNTLHGIKILSPQALTTLDGPILITTILHQQAIAAQIRQMGLLNEIVFLQE
jgi:SAM-dependent methyltransferase